MKIQIFTPLKNDQKSVFAKFNKDLFLKLSPPFPIVKLIRFDGMKVGDEVHLELNFLLGKTYWCSKIVDFRESAFEIYFTDIGTRLPPFLKHWKHIHRIIRGSEDDRCIIVDEIHFKTPLRILDYLMYPMLYLQFLYRRPIYRRILQS